MTPGNGSERLQTSAMFDNAWGGKKFGVWDLDRHVWRDDIGWFLTEKAAEAAIAAALPGGQDGYLEEFDSPGCQMCGAHEDDPCDCHDPQADPLPGERWGLVIEEPGTGSQSVPDFSKKVS